MVAVIEVFPAPGAMYELAVLRCLGEAPVVRFDDIMDALKRLDGDLAETPQYGKFINRAQRWKDLYHSDRGRHSAFA